MRKRFLSKIGHRLGRALPGLVLFLMLPGFAAAGYIGGDIPIADKNYDQQNPYTIYLPDKNVWFVVWEDGRAFNTTGSDIYGQFINGNDGNPCGSEFPIVNVAGNQTVPRAAYRPLDDKVIVVWQDTRGNANGGYVYYQPITTVPDDLTCAGYVPPAPAAGTAVGFNGTNSWGINWTPIPSTANIGTGDGGNSLFPGFLAFPVEPGSVSITDGTQTVTDNGFGALTGDGSGTISYSTGALLVIFASPPANGASIVVSYDYNVGNFVQAPLGDTLKSRKQPKIIYDSTRDIFWMAWSESRSILNFSSQICFGLAMVGYSYGDDSFPGYVELDGLTLAELPSETPDSSPPYLYNTVGPDIIRNGTVRTNRLIAASFGAFTETYEYEFFTKVNNLSMSSDSNSPETLMLWEGSRNKGVLTCTCKDVNENEVCDGGDTISSSFSESFYADGGIVHIFGLFDKEIHNAVIYSKWLDNSNTAAGNYPSVAFDPVSGRFLSAWEDNRDGTNTTKIYGQLIYSGSGLYGQNFIISFQDTNLDGDQDPEVANSKQTRPFVSYDPVNQRFFIVWQDGRNGGLENLDIFGQKVDAEGTLRGTNYAIFTKPYNQFSPSIAYNDVMNHYLSVWKDARNADVSTCSAVGGAGTGTRPCGSDVYGQRFTLAQPSITLLNMDDTLLQPVILMDFQNPPDSGSVTVGLFASQSFKIRSTGDATLSIDCIDRTCGGLNPSGISPFDFEGFDSRLELCNDGQTLDLVPGAEIPMTVRFEPAFGGTYNKCFIIESDGGNPRVNVSGIGVEPNITITPASHDFLSVFIGSTGEKAFVVKNTGTAGLIISSLDSPATPFTIQDGGCVGQMIMPGSTCTITARFTPTTTGPANATFGINSNDPDTPVLNVALSGSGLGAQDITVNPLSVAFGNVQVGQTEQRTIQVRNDGTAALTINSIGNVAAPFIRNHNCPISPSTLGVGGSCTITLQFTPTAGGSTAANVIILSDDPDEGTVDVNISGNGVTSEIPVDSQIILSPTTLDFLTLPVGQTATRTLTVSNGANADLTIIAVSNPSSPFAIESNNCTGKILAPAAFCTITVSFNPSYEAVYFPYYITITSSDLDNPTIKATLKGESGPLLSSVTTGVFRPSTGELFMKNTNSTGFADLVFNYGLPGDRPVVGDWNGNGITTLGIYRNGVFYLRNSNTAGFADTVFSFGQPGDLPIAGDWDGDGIETIGVYRNGTFLLRNSNSSGAPDYTFYLGIPGDVPIAGDWTGQGYDTVGVFRPSNGALYLKNTNTTGFADIVLNYGLPGDKPVTGDWDGNGTDTIGVFRNGTFMLRNSNTVGFADIVFALGIPGDEPIAGNWDGLP